MEYLIDLKVHFNSLNGIIWLTTDSNHPLILSRPGARLLKELVIHCSNTLSRDYLLKQVWENYGLSPSHSSLSNHISYLRKIFSQLGMSENIIITVPKKGFKLNTVVSLIAADEKNRGGNQVSSLKETRLQKKSILIINSLNFKWAAVSVSALIIIFSTLAIFRNSFYLSYYSEAQNGECKLINLSTDSKKSKKSVTIIQFIRKNKIICTPGKNILYYQIVPSSDGKKIAANMIFLAKCRQGISEQPQSCQNYLLVNINQ